MGLGSIGGAIGGVAGAIGSIYAANKSAKSAKRNTATQINWEREQAQNRIQWAVKDAIKAGINPAVAVGQAPGISGITPSMPDTSGYQQAGNSINTAIQLIQKQKEVDAEATKDYADALNAEVEAGLKPKETAIHEMNAETERRRQEQDAQESFTRIQRIITLLPGETEQQKQQIMQNAMDIALEQNQMPGKISEAQAENKIREMTGGLIGLNDVKAIIAGIAGGATYHYEQKQNRNSSERIARENRENTYRMHRENYIQKGTENIDKYSRTKYRQYYDDGYKEYWR